jgi:hypothetical protein
VRLAGFSVTRALVVLVAPRPSLAAAVAVVTSFLRRFSRFSAALLSLTLTRLLAPGWIVKRARPTLTVWVRGAPGRLCLRVSVPRQGGAVPAGHPTRTGALPRLTLTVCLLRDTPAKAAGPGVISSATTTSRVVVAAGLPLQ